MADPSQEKEADKAELLLWACARGLLDDVVQLVNQGCDPSIRDKKGLRPVHYAASKGHTEVVQYLLTRGVDQDVEDPFGRTSLQHASAWGHAETVKLLIKKGAWLDAYDGNDDTALHLACRKGYLEVVRALVNGGAKLTLVNKRSLTPMGEALACGQVEVARVLLTKNADIRVRSRGFTLLHMLSGLSQPLSLDFALKNGMADLVNDCSNMDQMTALHCAAAVGNRVCAELLVKAGANAAAVDGKGSTAADLVVVPPNTDEQYKYTVQFRDYLTKEAAKQQARSGKGGAKKVEEAAKKPAVVEKSEKAEGGDEGGDAAPYSVRFSREPKESQIRKVDGFARMEERELSQLDFLTPAALKAVLQVRSIRQVLTCFEAMLAVRADVQFQEDAGHPDVQAAIEEVKRTSSIERYLGDSRMMSVLGKLRKLQTVMRENGGMKLALEDLLVDKTPTPNEQQRLEALKGSLDLAREAAVKAICGESGLEAGPAPTSEIQESPSGSQDPEEASSFQAVAQHFWTELMYQVLMGLVVASLLLLYMWFTDRLPWQQPEWMQQLLLSKAQQAEAARQAATPLTPPDHPPVPEGRAWQQSDEL